MKRKLLLLLGMLGVCACSLFVRPTLTLAAAFPTCAPSYCSTHRYDACQCPPGTRRYPAGVASCDGWNADCNYL